MSLMLLLILFLNYAFADPSIDFVQVDGAPVCLQNKVDVVNFYFPRLKKACEGNSKYEKVSDDNQLKEICQQWKANVQYGRYTPQSCVHRYYLNMDKCQVIEDDSGFPANVRNDPRCMKLRSLILRYRQIQKFAVEPKVELPDLTKKPSATR